MLGMDAARQGYYRAFGGSPGLAYLLGDFTARSTSAASARRHGDALFVDNPARAFAFAPTSVPIRATEVSIGHDRTRRRLPREALVTLPIRPATARAFS